MKPGIRHALRSLCLGATLVLLAACSTVRLAYDNLPTVGYWWLDRYLDFNGAQTLHVREALDELQAWHRREELPAWSALLRQAQDLAPKQLSPAQACAMGERGRHHLRALAERASQPAAELAVTLGPAQWRQLESRYASHNEEYRREWLTPPVDQWQRKRYERLLDRFEDFYGRLDATQRTLLQRQVAQSLYDPRRLDTERRRRQQEVLDMLRQFHTQAATVAQAREAVHSYVRRIDEPPPGAWRDYRQALWEEGCRHLAELHNQTTPEQRERAAHRLAGYRADIDALHAGR